MYVRDMDREWLQNELNTGRSIESIARQAGLGSSTVFYWVKKYGLRSHHAYKHAARGGIPRELMEDWVAEGCSAREIAERLAVSPTTVGYWLRKYDLETARAKTKRTIREALAAAGEETSEIEAHCPKHGWARFVPRPDGYRCGRCRSAAVSERRRAIKAVLVEDAGGACSRCGYDRCLAALQFHHVDPSDKEFHLAENGAARSLDRARAEARKCVLLCANCHVEEEQRLANLPRALGR